MGKAPAQQGYQVGPGTVVALSYVLCDAEGEPVESSEGGEPLVLLSGYGDTAPGLDAAIQGLREGDTRTVRLSAEDAFGPRDPEAIIEVDRADLPPDVAPGDELEADRQDGPGVVILKVLEVLEDVVVLDTNHPLAGQAIQLQVTVQGVRPATPEELEEATRRMTQMAPGSGEALLPAERLLRRGRGEPAPEGEEPPPPRGRIA